MKEIIQYPDLSLKMKSERVLDINDYIKSIALELKYYINLGAPGISAVQLGYPIRFIALRFGNEVIFLVNPEITKRSSQTFTSYEGCLSLTKVGKIAVKRNKIVKVKGTSLEGKPVSYKGRDSFGIAIQHEVDHLDGKLINDN